MDSEVRSTRSHGVHGRLRLRKYSGLASGCSPNAATDYSRQINIQLGFSASSFSGEDEGRCEAFRAGDKLSCPVGCGAPNLSQRAIGTVDWIVIWNWERRNILIGFRSFAGPAS